MKNNTLKEIGEEFLKADTVLLFPHTNMDGDTLGSCVALCKALRKQGKTAYILVEEKVPNFLAFLDKGYCIDDNDLIMAPDICACIDCGDVDRFIKRKDKFLSGKTKICIDHHLTSEPFADYNYIDGAAAATGEIIYKLLIQMNITIDKEIGEAIFAAITTDTGNFQYSNTTKESHDIVSKLYDAQIDANKVSVEIYETVRLQKLVLTTKILQTMELFASGKAVIAYVTQDMLAQCDATMDETEGVVSTLRSIAGVEISAFLKENKDGSIKVSLRAKRNGDVAKIGAAHGGGGHTKAAGCTLHCAIQEAKEIMMKEIKESLSQ